MDAHDAPPDRADVAAPTLTAEARDRLRLVLSGRWRRRVTRHLAAALGAAGLNRLSSGDHCAALGRAAALLDDAPSLTIAAIEQAAATAPADTADLIRRLAAASARGGLPSPRRAATALRAAAGWRCVVDGTAADCPCITGPWAGTGRSGSITTSS